jgi:putative flippase GtrA
MPTAHIPQFLRFCLVGLVGFAVDAGALEGFVALGLSPAAARVLSITVALQATYILHKRFTFRATETANPWPKFMLANALGALINYLTFLVVMALIGTAFQALEARQSALLAGTATALLVNYWMNHRFVFARRA